MAVITRDQLQPFSMGHLGLAGAFIRETKIIEMIDFMIPIQIFQLIIHRKRKIA